MEAMNEFNNIITNEILLRVFHWVGFSTCAFLKAFNCIKDSKLSAK